MTKKETSFLSVDGKTNIHVIQWIPEKEPYKAILQITHGMVEFIDRYDKFASFLSDNGILKQVGTCDLSALELAKLLQVYNFEVVISKTDRRVITNTSDIMEVLPWMVSSLS